MHPSGPDFLPPQVTALAELAERAITASPPLHYLTGLYFLSVRLETSRMLNWQHVGNLRMGAYWDRRVGELLEQMKRECGYHWEYVSPTFTRDIDVLHQAMDLLTAAIPVQIQKINLQWPNPKPQTS